MRFFFGFSLFIGLALFYFSENRDELKSLQKISVRFAYFSPIPLLKVEIGNTLRLLKVDLGSGYSLSLTESTLNDLQSKMLYGNTQFFDFKGNQYSSPLYSVPSIHFGRFQFSNLVAKEESISFLKWGSRLGDVATNRRRELELSKIDGRVGREIFKSAYFLFDFPHKAIYVSEKKEDFSFSLHRYIQIPFIDGNLGVIIPVNTDYGVKNFLLDTGASSTFLIEKEGNPSCFKRFAIGSEDYGPFKMPFFQGGEVFHEIDGVLGIDFLRRYAFLLDFQNQIAYFQPPRKKLLKRFLSD